MVAKRQYCVDSRNGAPAVLKPALPLLLIGPQMLWLTYVVLRARQAEIGPW